jgi:hypothetical protein
VKEPTPCPICDLSTDLGVVVMVHTADGWVTFHAECLGVKVA